MATTQALIEHMRKSRAAGKDDAFIRAELLRFGWKGEDIQSAFEEYWHPARNKSKENDPVLLTENVMNMHVNTWLAFAIIGVAACMVVVLFAYQNLRWPTFEQVHIQNLYSVSRNASDEIASSTPPADVP